MQCLPAETKSSAPPMRSWILALALLAATAMVVASAPCSNASARPPAAGVSQESSQIVYLPLLLRYHWRAPHSSFGVQLFWNDLSLLTEPTAVGATWVRLPLYWAQIEPLNTTPENYTWPEGFESELARLKSQGVDVILTLMGNPSWAAEYPAGPVYDLDELVEFMEAVVGRYGAPPYSVKHWELYNEPDNGWEEAARSGEVGYFGPDPDAYVALLQAVYQPLKAVDPEAQIVFGGIAYDAFAPDGPFVRTFLDDVLAGGGGDHFDVMNFHYYLAFAGNWEAYGIDILGKYSYLNEKLASYGVHKPFICTETSMWSDEAHDGSDELQSRYVSQVFARTMSAGFRFTIWFRLVDDDQLGTVKWGLLDPDHRPKPAYGAYQTLARQLGGAAFLRTWPETETGSPLVEAYEFGPGQGLTWPDGTARIVVTWSNDEEDQRHSLAVSAAALVQVDKNGVETPVQDGDDGQVDGLIHLAIGPSPVYLRLPE
jgi:hypothetical protein